MAHTSHYQTRHFSSGFIGLPFWHWKASENASKFWSDPSTLKTKQNKALKVMNAEVCYEYRPSAMLNMSYVQLGPTETRETPERK